MQLSERPQQKQPEEIISPPSHPGEWSFAQIQAALKRKLPPKILKTLPDKGNAHYLPWWAAVEILDKYAPGWKWDIKDTTLSSGRIFIVGRLTIPTKDGEVYREAMGSEVLKKQYYDTKTNQNMEKEIPFGDPASNAESMCFRRCAAKMGLALYLYKK